MGSVNRTTVIFPPRTRIINFRLREYLIAKQKLLVLIWETSSGWRGGEEGSRHWARSKVGTTLRVSSASRGWRWPGGRMTSHAHATRPTPTSTPPPSRCRRRFAKGCESRLGSQERSVGENEIEIVTLL